jgi:starvation-inducible DNA-binding protein
VAQAAKVRFGRSCALWWLSLLFNNDGHSRSDCCGPNRQRRIDLTERITNMDLRDARALRNGLLATPTSLSWNVVRDVSAALNGLLADVFGLYLKTKNFHWHMSGQHFRDYHILLDEQSDQIFAMTDAIAERIRKIGGTTLRSIGHIGRLQSIQDTNADFVTPHDMMAELLDDNRQLTASMREVHCLCHEYGDLATASFLEIWIDETERRTWFLFETTRRVEP